MRLVLLVKLPASHICGKSIMVVLRGTENVWFAGSVRRGLLRWSGHIRDSLPGETREDSRIDFEQLCDSLGCSVQGRTSHGQQQPEDRMDRVMGDDGEEEGAVEC